MDTAQCSLMDITLAVDDLILRTLDFYSIYFFNAGADEIHFIFLTDPFIRAKRSVPFLLDSKCG